jgi:endonuclease/exonuclease/phosphatase family metal-dependent hydrolase
VQKSIVLVLCGLLCLSSFWSKAQSPAIDIPSTTEQAEPQLKVLSWNIYLLPRLIMQVGQNERSKLIAETLLKADYDVIVFQEAFDKKARNILWGILKEIYPYAVGPVNEARTKLLTVTNGGVWIVSRLPLKEVGEILFDNCKGFDCGSRKGALMVEVEKDGYTYQLIGTHLQAFDSPKKEEIRNKQLLQIKNELVDPYHVDGVPQLLCGDFNIHKRDVKLYTQMLKSLSACDDNFCTVDILEDNPATSGEMHTYDSKNNDLIDYEETTTLDYILVKENNFLFRSVRRRVATFVGNWSSKKLLNRHNLSDHHAVEITLVPRVSMVD